MKRQFIFSTMLTAALAVGVSAQSGGSSGSSGGATGSQSGGSSAGQGGAGSGRGLRGGLLDRVTRQHRVDLGPDRVPAAARRSGGSQNITLTGCLQSGSGSGASSSASSTAGQHLVLGIRRGLHPGECDDGQRLGFVGIRVRVERLGFLEHGRDRHGRIGEQPDRRAAPRPAAPERRCLRFDELVRVDVPPQRQGERSAQARESQGAGTGSISRVRLEQLDGRQFDVRERAARPLVRPAARRERRDGSSTGSTASGSAGSSGASGRWLARSICASRPSRTWAPAAPPAAKRRGRAGCLRRSARSSCPTSFSSVTPSSTTAPTPAREPDVITHLQRTASAVMARDDAILRTAFERSAELRTS